jgi:hypothetical protein
VEAVVVEAVAVVTRVFCFHHSQNIHPIADRLRLLLQYKQNKNKTKINN